MAKARGNTENLIPLPKRTKEAQREIQSKGGKASCEAKREKKRMSQIYADFLAAEHEIDIDDVRVRLEGQKLLAHVMKQVLARGDSSSVSMMKEMREAIEGSKLALSGELNVTDLTEAEIDKRIAELTKGA